MMSEATLGVRPQKRKNTLLQNIWKYKFMYLLFIPSIIYFIVFAYIPFYGLTIAFKKYMAFKGIMASPWVGLDNFKYIFTSDKFFTVLKNTIIIHMYGLIFGFPIPILFALLLNEVKSMAFKKTVQTVTYFPHFLSWIVFAGIAINFVGPTGVINTLLTGAGLQPIEFLTNTQLFRPVLIVTGIIKEFGWGAIIYLAAMSGIDPELYEAARVDGARRLRQIWHITLPGMRPIIILMFVLNLASMLDAGFDQVFNMYNPSVYEVADIIDTYVYRIGMLSNDYSVATAVGIFKGVVSCVLIISANAFVKKWEGRSMW
ncbi:ABC transporter permease subunit [Paenibacillus filicis]|uniref:ABC transporter permease subunit n=1 Tax=Paenibacillus filicis TaxID=669464 RepID=A0ABU9DHM5_9BACL